MSPTPKINASAIRNATGDRPVVTRFAPSPTGFLHLGHVVNAIWVWGIAGGMGGEVILRMEDHDRTRCKPVYEEGILEVLEWLGLRPDRGMAGEFRAGKTDYRQSDCRILYAAALESLREGGAVYPCTCSRRILKERLGPGNGEETCYDGYCRERRLDWEGERSLRLKIGGERVVFEDLMQGRQEQRPAEQCGDFVLRDRNGNWTYQFCVVMDDIRQGVNLVIRGVDILSSTGRQILLAKGLGHEGQPAYLHHGLLVDEEGRKLSKRDFASDVHARMRNGEAAEEVLGEAAWRAGLLDRQRPVEASELPDLVMA